MNNVFSQNRNRNKEFLLGKSFLSASEPSEVENRLTLLEAMLFKLSTQNEILTKRVEDLENSQINSNYIRNSHDFKLDDDDIIIEKNFDHKETQFDINEWKQDIEKSLGKISERVASNNSNPHINILEKRFNDFYNELIKLKKQYYEGLENNSKSNEKLEKTEKSFITVQSQFSEFKTNINKWQSDILYKIKILNEKIEIEENSSDLFKEFIKASNVKFENFSATIKNIINENKLNKDHFDNKYFERLKQLEDMDRNLISQITSLNKMINQEFIKYEVSNKALWDSLALLTSSIKGESDQIN